MTDKSLSCTRQISARVRTAMIGVDTIVVPDLINQIADEFGLNDSFMRQFASEQLRPSVDKIVQTVLSADRSVARHGSTKFLTHSALARAMAAPEPEDARDVMGLTPAEQQTRRIWLDRFTQYQPVRGVVMRLGEMTKVDLAAASVWRTEKGHSELRMAALFDYLAKGLKDGQKVQDRWTDEQIAHMHERLERKVVLVDIKKASLSAETIAAE